jgi:hypothetical protein
MEGLTLATKLTPEQQKAIAYWSYTEHIPIIQCNSRDKKVFVNGWQDLDLNNINYKQNIENGIYDHGIAIRLGKTIPADGNGLTLWSFCIDFDKQKGVEAWFGDLDTWDQVLKSSKRTRLEWHGNKEKLHYIFKAKRKIANRRIPELGIEIRCENQLVFSSPSTHKEGEEYRPLGTQKIVVLDELQLLSLEAKIDTLSAGYISDENKRVYINWLEKPDTRIYAGQGRHTALVILGASYFNRRSGEWRYLTDDEKRARLWKWNIMQCDLPKSEEEFNRIWKWIIDTFRKDRDDKWEKEEDAAKKSDAFGADMPGCVSYKINNNPDKFIAGTPWNTVVEVKRSWIADDNNPQQNKMVERTIRTFTACKPVKVTKHINPLSFLELRDKYTIEFRGLEPSGCFTAKHKTITEMVSQLNDGNALTDNGLEVMLQAQIKGFEKAGLLEVSDSLDYTGFFPSVDRKGIISSNITILENKNYPDVSDALDLIDELRTKWYEGREDLLAHILLWFMVAPLSFIFKVISAPLLDWVHPFGNPNTGKTSSGLIGLAIDGNECNEDFNLNMKHIDSLARFGDTISNTTFPKIINEVDLTERDDIVNNIITAVDAIKFRKTLDRNRISEDCPGLTPLFLTGNPQAPTKPEYVKRVKTRYSSSREIHFTGTPEAIEYKNWVASNLKRLHVLGKFRNKFVMEYQGIIMNTELSPFDKSLKIWRAIYESVNTKLPEFFNKKLDENQMSDSVEDRKSDISGALQAWIVDKCRSLDTNQGVKFIDDQPVGEHKILDQFKKSTDRLSRLIERNLIPYVKSDSNSNIVFYRQIITDLKDRYGLKGLDLPTLADSIPEARYGKFQDGYKVVKCTTQNLARFFGEEPEWQQQQLK